VSLFKSPATLLSSVQGKEKAAEKQYFNEEDEKLMRVGRASMAFSKRRGVLASPSIQTSQKLLSKVQQQVKPAASKAGEPSIEQKRLDMIVGESQARVDTCLQYESYGRDIPLLRQVQGFGCGQGSIDCLEALPRVLGRVSWECISGWPGGVSVASAVLGSMRTSASGLYSGLASRSQGLPERRGSAVKETTNREPGTVGGFSLSELDYVPERKKEGSAHSNGSNPAFLLDGANEQHVNGRSC
jgi:hypothetical protein